MSEIFEVLRKVQQQADARRQAAPSPQEAGPVEADVDDQPKSSDLIAGTSPRQHRRRRPRWLRWPWASAGHNGNGSAGSRNGAPLLTAPEFGTVIGEQFRALRWQVELAGPGMLMVTSAMDQEGKTLCACNLAIALSARLGAGVILVDADLRRPSVGSEFGLGRRRGLMHCLTGDAQWQDCLVQTQYSGLQILPAGRSSVSAPELLGSDRMIALVAEMRAQFPHHHIVFDTSPILLTSDALVMTRYMDRVVLVVRAGNTPRAAVLKAIGAIEPQQLLGVVLNDTTDSVSQFYHYGYGSMYGYRGGYGARDE